MKKTLTLLALAAALMPMMPHAAKAETKTYWVTGITLKDQNDYRTAEGWFDAEKERGTRDDNYLCWAAASSNLVAWWQEQQDYQIEAPKDLPTIWDEYRDTFANVGGHAELGLHWWLDGTYGNAPLRNPMQDSGGGYYSKSLVTDLGYNPGVRDVDLKVFELDELQNAKVFSRTLVSYISNGYGVELTWGFDGSSDGHSVTLWGVDYDDSKQVITNLYLSDSDHDPTTLKQVPVLLSYFEGYETLAAKNEFNVVYYKAWSFTVLNSRLSNDYHYFNILDEESGNIIMKQSVEGSMGYTLTEGTQEVKDIIFDGSRGTQNRLLTVEGVHTAERLCVNGAGTNTLDVKAGSKLVVGQVTGNNTLVKTGAGTLEIQQTPTGQEGATSANLDVREGDVVNHGSLGDVAVSGKGRLVSDGTAGTLTLSDGGVAEMKRSSGAQLFTQCEIEDGGVLKGSGTFGKVKMETGGTLVVGNSPGRQTYTDELVVEGGTMEFSIDDIPNSWHSQATETSYGWGSGKYSTIVMSNKGVTLNPDEIVFVLGSSLLENSAHVNDLADALDTNFTVTLNQVYFLDGLSSVSPLLSMSYQPHLDELELRTRFELNSEEANIVANRIQAAITIQDIEFYGSDGCAIVMNATLNVGLYQAAPPVPEPATGTLALLALAALAARRQKG
ncbi:MAG: hypothetical protein MJ058_03435 [Akkermansia sp.]|nr:hypothetical protein [Akkermansia sp.]